VVDIAAQKELDSIGAIDNMRAARGNLKIQDVSARTQIDIAFCASSGRTLNRNAVSLKLLAMVERRICPSEWPGKKSPGEPITKPRLLF
jgi:hypothetical protein